MGNKLHSLEQSQPGIKSGTAVLPAANEIRNAAVMGEIIVIDYGYNIFNRVWTVWE